MPEISTMVNEIIGPGNTVISLGCGICNESRNIIKTDFLGIDLYEPYITKLNKEGINAIKYDITEVRDIIAENSYDVVIIMDVIEHLTHEAGLKLIADAESIARKFVFIFTLDGFIKEPVGKGLGTDAWDLGTNKLQKHISGWSQLDFISRGYNLSCDYGLNYGAKTIFAFKII